MGLWVQAQRRQRRTTQLHPLRQRPDARRRPPPPRRNHPQILRRRRRTRTRRIRHQAPAPAAVPRTRLGHANARREHPSHQTNRFHHRKRRDGQFHLLASPQSEHRGRHPRVCRGIDDRSRSGGIAVVLFEKRKRTLPGLHPIDEIGRHVHHLETTRRRHSSGGNRGQRPRRRVRRLRGRVGRLPHRNDGRRIGIEHRKYQRSAVPTRRGYHRRLRGGIRRSLWECLVGKTAGDGLRG
mmetsp:Transcript_9589/g.20376  ORF Transcript_9589/g.20376 Transcript_9589/m.20376 type:complete len:238 (+) Transcript_9589:764-1477(+)